MASKVKQGCDLFLYRLSRHWYEDRSPEEMTMEGFQAGARFVLDSIEAYLKNLSPTENKDPASPIGCFIAGYDKGVIAIRDHVNSLFAEEAGGQGA